jgi:transmembrane sensor
MTSPRVQNHIDAARREVRVHAWRASKVESTWRELAKQHARGQAQRRRARFLWGGALAFAALFALGFGIRAALDPSLPPGATAQLPRAAAAQRVAFADGTEVRFDRAGQVEVIERNPERVVVRVQSGEAHFRVRHDSNRLFRVVTGDVVIDDLGTSFVVQNDAGTVTVSVSEGTVAVTFPDSGGRRSVTLEAGQSGTYAAENPSEPAFAQGSPTGPLPAPNGDELAPKAAAAVSSGGAMTSLATDWRELARAGKHQQAYDAIAPRGFSDVRDDPGDLLLASDVARLSQHPADAASLLRKLLSRHASDSRAPSAAFALGWVLMSELGRPREAAQAFARAEALAPRGNLAEDALARSVEAWHKAGAVARARSEFERYRARYPEGRHRATLERRFGTQ